MGLSRFSIDAGRSQEPGRTNRSLACRTGRSDVQVGPGDRKSVPAIRFGLDVLDARSEARIGARVFGER